MPFVKDESGTRAGRPSVARGKALVCEALIDAEGESLTRLLIGRAHEGDAAAVRLCLDRVLPRGSDRPVLFPLPRIESPEAVREAVGCITVAAGTGELTPRQAVDLLRVVERSARALAAAEAAARARGEDSPEAIAARSAGMDVVSAPGEGDTAGQGGSPEHGKRAEAVLAAAPGTARSPAPRSGSSPAIDVLRAGVRNNGSNGNTMKQGHPAIPPAAHANGHAAKAPGVT